MSHSAKEGFDCIIEFRSDRKIVNDKLEIENFGLPADRIGHRS